MASDADDLHCHTSRLKVKIKFHIGRIMIRSFSTHLIVVLKKLCFGNRANLCVVNFGNWHM